MFCDRVSTFVGLLFLFLLMTPVYALDLQGNGDKTGIQALYLFNENTGPVVDSSGVGTPLNLQISATTGVVRQNGFLRIESALPLGGIASPGAATKINEACRTSNQLSIEVWMRTTVANQNGPARIVSISESSGPRNFTLGQTYDGTPHLITRLRTTAAGTNPTDQTSSDGLTVNQLQHVIATRSATGTFRVYIDGRLVSEVNGGNVGGTLANWDPNLRLSLGSEFVDARPWLGELHLVAIYCRELTRKEIQGDLALYEAPSYMPSVDDPITKEREKAHLLFKRLTGVNTPIDNPLVAAMENKIRSGDMLGAANIATTDSNFYNIVVRDFAAKMSTREETVKAPLGDFTATIMGVVRDDINAQELLTGNFFYKANSARAAVRNSLDADIVRSNNHFLDLETGGYDIVKTLEKADQTLLANNSVLVKNPDPAGILTSRTFMEAHASAGTNRRLVEYTFRQFLCLPIEQWADATLPDDHVGRDIDRYPGGANAKFQTSCKTCHAPMDGMRGAFARFDFENGIIKFGNLLANGAGATEMKQSPLTISAKLNQNATVFPAGYQVTDDTWVNHIARSGVDRQKFGWSPLNMGAGVNQFGRMIASSKRFSTCMTRRVFTAVCHRDPLESEMAKLETVANEFATTDGFRLRRLFEKIAIRPECLGAQ